MTELVRYDAARKALADAKRTDEVLKVRNESDRLRLYARQAKDRGLEIDAAEIRMRAERRLGQLIAAQKQLTPKLGQGRRSDLVPRGNQVQKATLTEAGIDKKLSARAQKLAALPEKKFEERVEEWRENFVEQSEKVTARLAKPVTTARTVRSSRQRHPPRSDAVGVGYRSAGARLYFKVKELISDEFDALPDNEEQQMFIDLLEQTIADLKEQTVRKAANG